jgi:hypothetical protein
MSDDSDTSDWVKPVLVGRLETEPFQGVCTFRIVSGMQIDRACHICGHVLQFHQPRHPANSLVNCLMCEVGRLVERFEESQSKFDLLRSQVSAVVAAVNRGGTLAT